MRDSVDVSEMDINLTSDGEMSLERLIKKYLHLSYFVVIIK